MAASENAETGNSDARVAQSAKSAATEPPAGWVPTPEAKAKATRFRWIAAILWAVAIIGEGVGIFWLLRQRVFVGEDGTLVRNPDTGLLEEQGVTATFPQWAFITLLVLLVVIAALSITGSVLWKKANRLDPARRADKTRFFVQNQLGAIVAVVAFLPLVILIFLNKDMDKGQKTTAGIVGVVLAALAVFIGVDFAPASVEQYTADQSAVIQLLGKDEVVWVDGGKVYHVCDDVPAIQTGSEIRTGTTAQAVEAGKIRLTLQFASELRACDLPVPENDEQITEALRSIQAGQTDTVLPAPVWADPAEAPIVVEEAPAE
ncbi:MULTISPECIES: hypothetical protein [Microbacterium]|uniref:Uncharacterized protein n=1 Tax=Microbacterium maritypicum MF109 TaxID=1333857 RepID=T5KFM4_MICMQ|nr:MULTISPECIES: hypothetical protein [Microbacterium]EQM74289.1 hypothetical protein L687_02220 [Microbacterium maritypicum MF109]NIG64533.1 hypothetical protein [Microbacterium sp. Be9]